MQYLRSVLVRPAAVREVRSAEQWSSRWRVALAIVLLVGVAVRLPGLGDPPIEVYATRQFHSAALARSYYLAEADPADHPPGRVAVARSFAGEPIEPPIMETLAVAGYRVLDREDLLWPRLLSALWWTLSGALLAVLAARLFGPPAGVVAASVHLGLPFAVAASRAFQPEPLMVLLIVGTALAWTSYVERPTRRRLLVAAGLGAGAALVKLVALFYVVPLAAAALVFVAGSPRTGLRRGAPVLLATLAPAAAYHVYGTYVARFLEGQAEGRVLPRLLGTRFFWEGWVKRLTALVPASRPVALLVLAVVAAVVLVGIVGARGWGRYLLVAFLSGYVAFGLTFTLHYATHDYYHLPLVPIVAVGLAGGARRLGQLLWARLGRPVAVGVAGLLVAGLALFGAARSELFPLRPTPTQLEVHVQRSVAIGDAVDHSTRVGFMADHFGGPLLYYGDIAGVPWDFEADEPVERTFDRLYGDGRADYFVVAERRLLDRAPGLEDVLRERYERVAGEEDWLVFELADQAR